MRATARECEQCRLAIRVAAHLTFVNDARDRLHYGGHGMKSAFHLRPRTRRRLAWLVALMLLWQQVAVAAYACTTVPASLAAAATQADAPSMAAMGNGCAEMPAAPTAPVGPICQQHCQPGHATQVDVRTASVPFNALTALPPMLLSVAAAALPSHRTLARLDRLRAPPPAPMLLYCALLI